MTKHDSWQTNHAETITSFIKHLNEITDKYVLKGGTALTICYSMDRFSEDIDLDCTIGGIEEIVDRFCKNNGFTFRIAKDTATVKRYMINYGNAGKPLKIEISFRKKFISPEDVTQIGGITVYKIDSLCIMKANAYASRDKIRDLHDLVFICNKYWDELPVHVKSVVRNAVEFKGIEQFDYLLKDQQDELIDKDRLAGDFLDMYDKLGLLYDEWERQIITETYEISKPDMDIRMQ